MNVQILNSLIFYSLIADIQPISKIFPQLFLMEFYLLINIEFFSQFDEDTVDSIEIITIISTSCSEVQDDEIIISTICF